MSLTLGLGLTRSLFSLFFSDLLFPRITCHHPYPYSHKMPPIRRNPAMKQQRRREETEHIATNILVAAAVVVLVS